MPAPAELQSAVGPSTTDLGKPVAGVSALTPVPKLAVGLPVYNGEPFIGPAIESYLAQTFTDFELVICDNASTDNTESICRKYAERDKRIRYTRNPQNLGAAPNLDRVFHLSQLTPYFKWTAADDLYAPTYLEKCIAALEADPTAVLCHSGTRVIDEAGDEIPVYGLPGQPAPDPSAHAIHFRDVYDLPRNLRADSAAVRFYEVILRTRRCMDIWGVMRRPAIMRTHLHESFYGSDKVMLSSLCLSGKFLEVSEPLYLRRHHQKSSDSIKSASERDAWMDTSKKKKKVSTARLQCLKGYRRSIAESDIRFGERLSCYTTLAKYLLQWERWKAVWREKR